MSDYILEMKNITKRFPGVLSLDNVSLNVEKGSVHALVGENGAGKSTLMKILSGLYVHGTYEGEILFKNETRQFNNIKDSENAGIAIINQELALVQQMSITENIFLGRELVKYGLTDKDEMYKKTAELLKTVKLDFSPDTLVSTLGVGHQQLVEIAKGIHKEADLIVFDEPTASLTKSEAKTLFEIMDYLKDKGVTCIYISHKLDEIFKLSDNITVLRDGQLITTFRKDDIDEQGLVKTMVGRELKQFFPREQHEPGEVVLEVKNWCLESEEIPGKNIVNNVSFEIRKGEVLGFAGLVGAGRTELFQSIFGVFGNKITHGTLKLNGKEIKINSPEDAVNFGIGYMSEDRKKLGLVLKQSIKDNIVLSALPRLSKGRFLTDNNEIIKESYKYTMELAIKTPSINELTMNLSGGNQQKVVLAKWLAARTKILVIDEPTRGIDIGAKYEIYKIVNKLIDEGVCVVMVSSEMEEILGMSDRIIVMNKGEKAVEIDYREATQEKILQHAIGGKNYGE